MRRTTGISPVAPGTHTNCSKHLRARNHVSPDKRPRGGLYRKKIAHESGARAEFHMPRAAPAIDEHRADRRTPRVFHRKALKAVLVRQLTGRLLRVQRVRPRRQGL